MQNIMVVGEGLKMKVQRGIKRGKENRRKLHLKRDKMPENCIIFG